MEIGHIVGGKYRLRREIGEGAMGAVWAATHEVLGREVAIKVLLPGLSNSETAAARFVEEAKAAARVKHRFVVDVFDFGVMDDGRYYMVQELLEGASLADTMWEEPAWKLPDVLQFTAQCLSGLEAVHQIGIIHRDLKPENIFVLCDPDGTHPKLLDFGISKLAESTSGRSLVRPSLRQGRPRRLTAVGTTLGTPAYMSPEQLRNASGMDGRADLYSMGVILFEWLSGQVPFGDISNPTELYRRIMAQSGPSLRSLRPDLGSGLYELIERAMEPDPARRFASAAEMRAGLLRILPLQPPVFSRVQKGAGTYLAVTARAGSAMGKGTQVQLAGARNPYQDDEPISIPGIGRGRVYGWVLAGAVACGVAGLAVLLWPAGEAPHAAAAAPRESPAAVPAAEPRPEQAAAAASAPAEAAPEDERAEAALPDPAVTPAATEDAIEQDGVAVDAVARGGAADDAVQKDVAEQAAVEDKRVDERVVSEAAERSAEQRSRRESESQAARRRRRREAATQAGDEQPGEQRAPAPPAADEGAPSTQNTKVVRTLDF